MTSKPQRSCDDVHIEQARCYCSTVETVRQHVPEALEAAVARKLRATRGMRCWRRIERATMPRAPFGMLLAPARAVGTAPSRGRLHRGRRHQPWTGRRLDGGTSFSEGAGAVGARSAQRFSGSTNSEYGLSRAPIVLTSNSVRRCTKSRSGTGWKMCTRVRLARKDEPRGAWKVGIPCASTALAHTPCIRLGGLTQTFPHRHSKSLEHPNAGAV